MSKAKSSVEEEHREEMKQQIIEAWKENDRKRDDPMFFDHAEYGISMKASGTWRAARGFFLGVIDGPPVGVLPGRKVRLSDRTAALLFKAGKIEPLTWPKEFYVIHPFALPGPTGEWVEGKIGDLIKLQKEEGLKFWRGGYIEPRAEEEVRENEANAG